MHQQEYYSQVVLHKEQLAGACDLELSASRLPFPSHPVATYLDRQAPALLTEIGRQTGCPLVMTHVTRHPKEKKNV